jgi:hypothetical protein
VHKTEIDGSQLLSRPKLVQGSSTNVYGNVSQFKYLGTTVAYQNLIQEEIKRTLSSGNACYHSVQSLLSSLLLSKNLKMRIYNNFACDFVWVQNLVSDTKGGT